MPKYKFKDYHYFDNDVYKLGLAAEQTGSWWAYPGEIVYGEPEKDRTSPTYGYIAISGDRDIQGWVKQELLEEVVD
jgi:hypothetical protein